jgi:hypothetical protein
MQPTMPTPLAPQLGTASALAVGLSVAHQALKITPLAVSQLRHGPA